MNNITIIGTITRDIEIKYLPSGTAVAKFGIAWNEKVKNHSGGYDDKAHFFDVVAWGKTAENINRFFHKGKQIGITGSLSFESWLDHQQQKRSRVIIKMKEFDFIGSKESNNSQTNNYSNNGASGGYDNNSYQQNQTKYNPPVHQSGTGGESYQQGMNQQPAMDNDIPIIDIDNDEIPF